MENVVYEVKPFLLLGVGVWGITLGILGTISGAGLACLSLLILNQRADYRGWWPYNQ